LNTLDKLSARHASALPQVRHAVDRIQKHLEPLMSKVRGDAGGLGEWAGAVGSPEPPRSSRSCAGSD
jgi:hypothetical protein